MFSEKNLSFIPLSDLTLDLYRNILLSHLEIDVPVTYTREQLHELLKILKIYKNKFASADPGELTAVFNNKDFVDLENSEGVLMFGIGYCVAPCAICNIAVTDGIGKLGQGLNCSGCGRWFHNNCNNEPLTSDAFSCLSESPDYVRVVCPHCFVGERNLDKSMESLNNELKNMKSEMDGQFDVLKNSLSDLTSFVKSIPIDYPCSCPEIDSKLDSLCNIGSNFSDHIAQCENSHSSLVRKLEEIETRNLDVSSNSMTDLKMSVHEIQKNLSELSEKIQPYKAELLGKTVSSAEETVNDLKESVDSTNVSMKNLETSLRTSAASYEAALEAVVSQANRLNTVDIHALSSGIALSHKDLNDRLNQEVLHPGTISNLAEKVAQNVSTILDTQTIDQSNNASKKKNSCDSKCLDKLHTKIDGLTQYHGSIQENACSGQCVLEMQAKLDSIISISNPLTELSTGGSSWSTVVSDKTRTLKNGSVTSTPKKVQESRPNHQRKQPKNEMDIKKTISIGNVNDPAISNSAKIKSQFNKCFPQMEIIHCKRAINGFILIEVDSSENARKVVQSWDGSKFFHSGIGSNTYAHLLEDARAKAIIEDVDKDLSDEFLTQELQKMFPKASAKRLKNKFGPTHVVLLVFSSKAEMEKASSERITIGNTIYRTRPYEIKKRLIQCYQCFSFNHIARNCTKARVCPFCCGSHEDKDCEIKKKKETEKYVCINCRGNHAALSKDCDVYKKLDNKRENYND